MIVEKSEKIEIRNWPRSEKKIETSEKKQEQSNF